MHGIRITNRFTAFIEIFTRCFRPFVFLHHEIQLLLAVSLHFHCQFSDMEQDDVLAAARADRCEKSIHIPGIWEVYRMFSVEDTI